MDSFKFRFEDSDAPEVCPFLQKDINVAASDGDVQAVKCLLEDGADVNDKDIYGRTPLHYAVNNGHLVTVNILLKHGADVTRVTNKGSTPLHTVSYKGYRDIVEVLLQHVPCNKLNSFVNAKTYYNGNTSLHIAAKAGCLEAAKKILKHGAVYESKNKEGKMPIDLCVDEEVTNFLTLIEEMFRDIKTGSDEAISKLTDLQPAEFLAIINACDSQGNTLLQAAVANKQIAIADKLLKIREASELDQLKRLKYAADLYVIYSELYLPVLRRRLQSFGSEENILEQGSYYLQNAHRLVQVYKEGLSGPADDESIRLVHNSLVALEFDPKHITSEYSNEVYGGNRECFISKGQGSRYYKLLCSGLKEDIRLFLEEVELDIHIPIKRYLRTTKQKLMSEQLLQVIQSENLSEVKNCIKNVADINFKDRDGRTPLHYAANIGNVDIVSVLLQNRADVTQITNSKGNSPLHLASSKGFTNVVKVLLQNVSHDKLNYFLNAKTASGGNTALHIASKGGYLETVKVLLSHGANYATENKEGKLPVELSEKQDIINLLNLIDDSFRDMGRGDITVIWKLRRLQTNELSAIINACNMKGDKLLQVALSYQHTDIAYKLLRLQEMCFRYT